MPKGDFVSKMKQSGYTTREAERAYDALRHQGYKDPRSWHASRAESLFRKSFIEEGKSLGRSSGVSQRIYSDLKAQGYRLIRSYHAHRVNDLLGKAFIKQRVELGVPRDTAKKELNRERKRGHKIGKERANQLPKPPGVSDGIIQAGARLLVTVGDYIKALEETMEEYWSWQLWVTSLYY